MVLLLNQGAPEALIPNLILVLEAFEASHANKMVNIEQLLADIYTFVDIYTALYICREGAQVVT